MAKIVKFENGKYGIRKWAFWPTNYEYLDNAKPNASLEFWWWNDVGGHSPGIRKNCEFDSVESAQEKLSRWVAYKNRPSSAINDKGTAL